MYAILPLLSKLATVSLLAAVTEAAHHFTNQALVSRHHRRIDKARAEVSSLETEKAPVESQQ
jgi:hypothetical protein